MRYKMILDLQLFAEGAGTGAGAGAGNATGTGTGTPGEAPQSNTQSSKRGARSNPLADVKYGVQPSDVTETPAEDRNAKYEAFIKEHKDLDDARIQSIVKKQTKNSKDAADKYNALVPTLELLAKKYGVDASDAAAIAKAIEDDDSYFEAEALEKGVSVEQLKQFRKIERENVELRRQMENKNRRESAEAQYAEWTAQEKEAKRIYPSLKLETEVGNPQFMKLLKAGIDVGTAYSVVHRDDIIPAAMQYAATEARRGVISDVAQGRARPTENGNRGSAAATVKNDVTRLTRADRAEINRRVMRGEKISFS